MPNMIVRVEIVWKLLFWEKYLIVLTFWEINMDIGESCFLQWTLAYTWISSFYVCFFELKWRGVDLSFYLFFFKKIILKYIMAFDIYLFIYFYMGCKCAGILLSGPKWSIYYNHMHAWEYLKHIYNKIESLLHKQTKKKMIKKKVGALDLWKLGLQIDKQFEVSGAFSLMIKVVIYW